MDIYRYEKSIKEVQQAPKPVIFLAGPTVRGNQPHLTSWRFEAIKEFEKQGFNGSLVIPEFTSKTESDKGKDWIVCWEYNGLCVSDCIVFWLPRTRELIGLTTNFELGYWLGTKSEKVVYGRPDDAYRVTYVDLMWDITTGRIIHKTLDDTVKASLKRVELP